MPGDRQAARFPSAPPFARKCSINIGEFYRRLPSTHPFHLPTDAPEVGTPLRQLHQPPRTDLIIHSEQRRIAALRAPNQQSVCPHALPASQRQLITLILFKLSDSSLGVDRFGTAQKIKCERSRKICWNLSVQESKFI